MGVIGGNGVEMGELFQMQKNFQKIKEEIPIVSTAIVQELAARLLAKVVKRTPVGEYNKSVNFTTKDGKKVSFTPHNGRVGGNLRRSWKIGQVTKVMGDYVIEVFNTAEYADFVNYGHRTRGGKGWVMGSFFLTISEKELQRDMPAIIERKLENAFQRYFHE